MKKFSSAVLALSLVAILPMNQVMAQEVSLDSAINNLQYGLTVEWDQKDEAVKKEVLKKFSADVEQLRKKGTSDEAIFKGLSARAFDAQTAKDLQNLAEYAKAKKLSKEETRKLVVEFANKSQKLGTSWSGAAVGIAIGLVIAVVLVAVLAGGGTVYVDTQTCYDDCYYDWYGYYYCDTVCY